jgi:hypothetical protein
MQKATHQILLKEKNVFIKDGYEWIKVNLAELVYVEGVITMSSSTKQKKLPPG